MSYRAELGYLIKVLGKMRVQVVRMRPDKRLSQPLDMGLRKLFGLKEDYVRLFRMDESRVKENTICKITDLFLCNYVALPLPGAPEGELLLVGPYLTWEKNQEELMEEAERYALPAQHFRQLKHCYSNIPVISDEGWLFALFHVLGETLWGAGEAFSIVEFRQDETESEQVPREETRDSEEIMMHIKSMEERYGYENQLMEMVSQGLTHRAEMMISRFSTLAVERRAADELRNVKNYTVICNTLLRKAAEKGGVHPVYLDSTSSDFARQAETLTNVEDGTRLMREMVRGYCRLVRQHSIWHYSPIVQKTVAYIESDPTGDLSLRALAAMQNVSASYLSTLFHKETGKTITEYVTQTRMELAARLLYTSHLQVQTVARHCGMSDINYFAKVFKRHFGVSPKKFREERRSYPPKQI